METPPVFEPLTPASAESSVLLQASSLRRGLSVVKILYFLFYAAFGIFVTYINLYYRSLGLSGTQIGWLSGIVPAVAVFCGPLWGYLNDRLTRPRLQLSVAALGSVGAFLALSLTASFGWLLAIAGCYSLFNCAIIPITDTTNLVLLGEHHERYGQQRIWGSTGFILMVLGMGVVVNAASLRSIFPVYAGAMLFLLASLAFLPGQKFRLAPKVSGGLKEMIRQPKWLLFALSLLFIGIAMSGMNNFLGVYLKMLGGSDLLVGGVYSLSALTELPIMFFGTLLIRRMGLKRMLAVGFLVYAIRFALYAAIPTANWALPISLLHGLSFGMYWVASVVYVNRMAPEHLKATAQGLFFATVNLSTVLGAVLGGAMLDRIGPSGMFVVDSVIALVGLGVLLIGFRYAPEAPTRAASPLQ